MDFFKNRQEDVGFYQGFLFYPLQSILTHCRNCKWLREFRKIELTQAIEVTLNSKEKNS
jgi:hypothetical protein